MVAVQPRGRMLVQAAEEIAKEEAAINSNCILPLFVVSERERYRGRAILELRKVRHVFYEGCTGHNYGIV